MKKCVFLALSLFLVSQVAGQYERSFRSASDWEETLYDWKIDVTPQGQVRLLRTELIADEMGVTTGRMREKLSGNVWAKKEFFLDQVGAERAVLLIHWNSYDLEEFKKAKAFLWVVANGHPIKLFPDIDRMLTGGWIRCDIPVSYLRPGRNEFILRNETDFPFFISVEASRLPNRSAKSVDGGATWDYHHLGEKNYIDGEYLIRLRLSRYPAEAEILSDFIEVASLVDSGPVKPNVRLKRIRLASNIETPRGTSVVLHLRGGKTPSYTPETWSPWLSPENLRSDELRDWRFVQWRAKLQTADRRVTPVLNSLTLSADLEILNSVAKTIAIRRLENPAIIRGYYSYCFQDAAEPRLQTLRRRYRLDEVIGGCSTEFQEYRTLAFWLKGAWRDGWGPHGEELHTPWDALISLELTPQYKASGMCTIYANTFVQTALAVGLQARGIILDHHFVSEVWSNDHQKWVMFDIGNSGQSLRPAFQEKDGIPLNSLEIHELARADRCDEIWIVPAGIHEKIRGGDDLKEKILGPRQWKARFGMPLRNNFLSSWLPGELEHGFIQYHYDGYLWWKDTPIPVYEEYTFQSSHKRDFYWTINQAQVFLRATSDPGILDVTLETVTPNFQRFEIRVDGKDWTESPATFSWILHEGTNTLEARTVNSFGRPGTASVIELLLTNKQKS